MTRLIISFIMFAIYTMSCQSGQVEKSKIDNWETPAQAKNYLVKRGERDTYTGLKKVLEKNKFPFEVKDIKIPNGDYEEEIWEIFESVYNVLKDGDEVYFDITHAFRSIPMLVMVLINYAKFLKNIKVKSITYGNWEARDSENFAPIMDLITFSD